LKQEKQVYNLLEAQAKDRNALRTQHQEMRKNNEKPSDEDSQGLFALIQNHYHATESSKALQILEDWDKHADMFIKVIPTDYKKALARIAEEKAVKQTV